MPAVLKAQAEQESGFRPFAIRVEATATQPAQSIFPSTHAEAVRIATEQDARGRLLGLGMMQITGRANWARHGLTIATALDGCASLRAGTAHYLDDVRAAALQRYNSGRLDGAPAYAAAVLRRVERAAEEPVLSAAPLVASSPELEIDPEAPPEWDVWASASYVRQPSASDDPAAEDATSEPLQPRRAE